MRRDLIIASSDILGEIIANYLNQYLNLKKEDNNITFFKPAFCLFALPVICLFMVVPVWRLEFNQFMRMLPETQTGKLVSIVIIHYDTFH